MLGEDHSLAHEFPDFVDVISTLSETDEKFAQDAKQYHRLDKEIRVLELKKSPIDDLSMNQLKHNRSLLKDSLFKRLVLAKN